MGFREVHSFVYLRENDFKLVVGDFAKHFQHEVFSTVSVSKYRGMVWAESKIVLMQVSGDSIRL